MKKNLFFAVLVLLTFFTLSAQSLSVGMDVAAEWKTGKWYLGEKSPSA